MALDFDPLVFDPTLYSIEENTFILNHAGEPPVVALSQKPADVIRAAVEPAINRIWDLMQLKQHQGVEWVGLDAIKEAIKTYLFELDRWEKESRLKRGAPRFPSMHSFDSKGRPHRYGPGSDAGRVKTYFTSTGERKPFAIEMVPSGMEDWTPTWAAGVDDPKPTAGLFNNADKNRIECMIAGCGHTESYKPDSRSSFNAARARISKHLRSTTNSVDAHREVHTNEFGGVN